MAGDFKYFSFWCQKVLPLVYDDSLSYYEILCKIVDYINNIIVNEKEITAEIEILKRELENVQEWIANVDTSYAESIIKKYIATMIFLEISDSGYILYFIPDTWEDINFNTTGKDIQIDGQEYGRLVLSY